jgi:hypothetical protein
MDLKFAMQRRETLLANLNQQNIMACITYKKLVIFHLFVIFDKNIVITYTGKSCVY